MTTRAKDGISVRVFEKNKVVLEKEIGSGSFGKVFKATIAENNLSPIAVKVFRKELKQGEISQREKDAAYEELLKLAVLDHENIVKLHGMVQDASSELPWLVFEFMKDGNLLEYVIKNDNIRERTLIRFCRDICNGMAFLHSHQVHHKDLAARNILLSDQTAKIADLGLSSFLTNDEGGIYALNGKLFPYRHAAVECIVEQVYTYESDVWSFGVLMHEVFNGGLTPYGKHNKQAVSPNKKEVRGFIVEGITPLHLLEPHCSTKIILMMKSILNPNMKERPNFYKLYTKFQKLLNGTLKDLMSSENSPPLKDASVAFSTFHKIKANGLSSSVNNLQIAASSSNLPNSHHVLLSASSNSTKEHHKSSSHLTVSENYSSKSSSTPDIVTAMEENPNGMQNFALNFLSVRSAPDGNRRHSLAKLDNEIPLPQRRNSVDLRHSTERLHPQNNVLGSPKLTVAGEYLEQPRRRLNSGSRLANSHLLEGFVQNRFSRRT